MSTETYTENGLVFIRGTEVEQTYERDPVTRLAPEWAVALETQPRAKDAVAIVWENGCVSFRADVVLNHYQLNAIAAQAAAAF